MSNMLAEIHLDKDQDQTHLRAQLTTAIKMVKEGKTWDYTAKLLKVSSPKRGTQLSGSGLATLAKKIYPTEYPRRKKEYTREDGPRFHTSARELPNDAELLTQIGNALSLTALAPSARVSAIRAMVTRKDRQGS